MALMTSNTTVSTSSCSGRQKISAHSQIMNMKKTFIALATCCCLLTGCLNITDELFLETNGSGRYITTVKMDKLQEMMEMVKSFAPDSLQSVNSMSGLKDSLQQMMADLSNIPGISDVKSEKRDSSSFTVSFRFKDVKALNAALKKRRKEKMDTGEIFSYSKGSFACQDKSIGGMSNMMDQTGKSDQPGMTGDQAPDLEQIKAMMKMLDWSMTMKTIYHFPGKVTNYSNKMAQLSPDGKTLTLELDLLDDNKEKTLENKVEFR